MIVLLLGHHNSGMKSRKGVRQFWGDCKRQVGWCKCNVLQ